ncbi:hypothetical protein [Streptomyces liliifuscus]|uniref:Secreted protein n=1 Tax=Streptomyces liliifuscus TaxID=2797636 RepID=A0A7T7L2D6_9ACTN|nr:hypothetical protein [Streptomyces liliifuscus]QQM45169.1 hypothetical protein JEQ17_41060 [Streptomyces liliifuscus]
MNATIRHIAVSGSALVALLGGAAAITTVTAQPASAADMETAINRATGASVNMPDGRTLHVRGMDAASYRATDEHTRTVILAAAKSEDDPNIGNGLTPDNGSGAALQNPNQPSINGQVPANTYNPQQVQTQAGGGTISLTVAIGLALLAIVIVMVKKGHVKFAQAFACVALGVYLAPTFFGPLIQQLGGSAATGLGNVWAGF